MPLRSNATPDVITTDQQTTTLWLNFLNGYSAKFFWTAAAPIPPRSGSSRRVYSPQQGAVGVRRARARAGGRARGRLFAKFFSASNARARPSAAPPQGDALPCARTRRTRRGAECVWREVEVPRADPRRCSVRRAGARTCSAVPQADATAAAPTPCDDGRAGRRPHDQHGAARPGGACRRAARSWCVRRRLATSGRSSWRSIINDVREHGPSRSPTCADWFMHGTCRRVVMRGIRAPPTVSLMTRSIKENHEPAFTIH